METGNVSVRNGFGRVGDRSASHLVASRDHLLDAPRNRWQDVQVAPAPVESVRLVLRVLRPHRRHHRRIVDSPPAAHRRCCCCRCCCCCCCCRYCCCRCCCCCCRCFCRCAFSFSFPFPFSARSCPSCPSSSSSSLAPHPRPRCSNRRRRSARVLRGHCGCGLDQRRRRQAGHSGPSCPLAYPRQGTWARGSGLGPRGPLAGRRYSVT